MKLLFLAPRFHTNQVPVVRALLAHGHEVLFLSKYVAPVENHVVLEPRVISYHRPVIKAESALVQTQWQVPRVRELLRTIEDFDPDIVVVRTELAVTDAFVLGWLTLRRRKFLLYSQGEKYRTRVSPAARVAAKTFVGALGNGWFTPVLRRGDGGTETLQEMDFLPFPWADEEAIPKDWSKFDEDEPVRLLCVGKYARYKNMDLLLAAVSRLVDRSRFHLTIIGERTTREHGEVFDECVREVQRAGLEDRVTLRTHVSHTEMLREFAEHDVLVQSSYRESFSMVILEGMGCGLPVVSGDLGGSASYVDHGTTGFIFPSGSLEGLVGVLEQALAKPSPLPRMGRCAAASIQQKYSPAAFYSAFQDIVRRRLGISID